MKKFLSNLLIVGAFVLPTMPAHAGEWKKIVIGMDVSYAPWAYTDANGKFLGYEVDLANDLCKRMEVECELTSQPWDTIIPSLQAGKFDAIIAGMNITEEQLKEIDFSVSYAASPRAFLTTKSSKFANLPLGESILDLEKDADSATKQIDAVRSELPGSTLGVLTASANTLFVEKNFADVAEIRQYKTAEQYVLDLQAGRIDIAFDTLPYLMGVLKGADGGDMVVVGPKLAGGLLGAGAGVGLRKSDADLKAMFNKAIEDAKKDGTIKALTIKWFGADLSPT